MNATELKQLMARQAGEIAQHLLPQGKQKGPEWKAGSTAGEPGDSLSVRIKGERAGVWKDFAADEGGDLLDLWMATRGATLVEAMQQAKKYLGIRDDMPKAPEKTYRKPERPPCQTPKGPVVEWLTSRGLTEETIRAFKIGEQIRGGAAHAVFPFLDEGGELLNCKYRNVADKRDMRQEAGTAPSLYGWHLVGAKQRQIVLTEGEIDAMTLHQVGIPAMSVNQGAGAHQWIEYDWQRLERFDDILVAYDDDTAGDKGAAEVIRRLGVERCRRLKFPKAKDANEYLQAGAERADFLAAIDDARPVDPEELVNADDFTEQVIERIHPPENAHRYPLLFVDKALDWFEFRPGEYTSWSGWNGHGKSLFIDQVLLGLMHQGEFVVVFSGELMPDAHLERIHRQATGRRKPAQAYIRAVGAWLRTRCWFFNLVGSAKLDRLIEVFTYASKRYGVRHFVIDSLMMIDVPVDGPGALSAQKVAVQKLTDFAKRHGAHVHLVAHPRKGRDDGGIPGKMDVAGSADITNAADNVFVVWRNKKDEAAVNQDDPAAVEAWQKKMAEPDAKLILSKSRHGDVQDYTLALWWDKESMQYRTQSRRHDLRFVEFSNQEAIDADPKP